MYVVNATRRAKELYTIHGGDDHYYKIPDGANEFDPSMNTDYTGTLYAYWEVELEA